MDPVLRKALQLRAEYSQAAVKKYNSIQSAQRDGRVYDTLQAWGAGRTGRWSGRTLQPQNMKRPTMEDPEPAINLLLRHTDAFPYFYRLEDLGSLVRSSIAASTGKMLVVADLASIESRVLGWMTGCRGINEAVARQQDLYKVFASEWLGVPYEAVSKKQRALAKPAVLGAGYGLGGQGLQTYAASMDIEMDLKTAQSAVAMWRATYYEVPVAWRRYETIFKNALVHPGVPMGPEGQEAVYEYPFLRWRLPSGRFLWYFQPQVDMDGQLTYMGKCQYTSKWKRLYTWGGKITENRDQGISRDVLLEGLLDYHQAGGCIVGHVHDEIIAEEDSIDSEAWLEQLKESMRRPLDWAPGLMLDASGYVSQRYRKD